MARKSSLLDYLLSGGIIWFTRSLVRLGFGPDIGMHVRKVAFLLKKSTNVDSLILSSTPPPFLQGHGTHRVTFRDEFDYGIETQTNKRLSVKAGKGNWGTE